MNKYAYVTFIIRNDSYLPGALVFAYALRLQNTKADLICIVSDNISEYAINSLKLVYNDVIVIDEVYVPHDRRQERQDRPFLFSRFNAFRLGIDGDLNKKYEKIMIADCDLLPLHNYDELFDLPAPAGIIPESLYLQGTWKWHDVYFDVPHGTLIPKKITDRIKEDKQNMGVNASLYLFEPSSKFYESIMEDLDNVDIQKEISLYNWPEMQYITLKLSGLWTNIDLKYSSFNGYPDIEYLYGSHFAGLKPWNIKNKSIKSFGRFDDYKLWYFTYIKMCDEIEGMLENRKIKKLYNKIVNLTEDKKFQFYKKHIAHLSHFFE